MKKILVILIALFIANFVLAVEITPIQLKPNFFERVSMKIQTCKWSISCYFQPRMGTTLTTISGSDTVQNALKVITNNNFTALNSGKMEKSTTTLYEVTSATSLTAVGTLTTGTWNATAIGVSKGGTGLTSPTQYLTMLGNGAYGLTVASSTGTSGQFWISNGAGAYPSWQSSTINQNDNYTWTGLHSFAATTTIAGLNASSTPDKPLKLNGINYAFPATQNASSTVLQTDGSGNLLWDYSDWQELGTTIVTTATSSMILTGLPAKNDLKIVLSVDIPNLDAIYMQFNSDSAANYGFRTFQNYVGSGDYAGVSQITLVSSTSSLQYIILDVHNKTATRKLINWYGSASSGGSTIPTIMTGAGVWNNTTSNINQVYIYSPNVDNFSIGSRLTVYGSRD